MNPVTATGQARLLCILLVAVSIVNPIAGLILAGIVLLIGLRLWLAYVMASRKARELPRSTLPAAPEEPPAGPTQDGLIDPEGLQRRWQWRNPSDWMVFRSLLLAAVLPAITGIGTLVFGHAPVGWVPHEERVWAILVPPTLIGIAIVSIQGTQINQLVNTIHYGGEPFPNHKGQLVDPKDVTIEGPEFPFRGCERVCSGVNWYCDYNWRQGRYR